VIAAWVRLWDRREPADVLALVRIGVALVIVWDLLQAARLDVVELLLAPIEDGGIGPASRRAPVGELYTLIGASLANAWLLFAVTLTSALTLLLGLFTRTSALVLVLSYAQLAYVVQLGDRGIDALLRSVLLILACSRAGATMSLDARLFHGRWLRDAEQPAWPRYLIVAQLALMYFWAGVLKQGPSWTSIDGYSALFIVLNHPHYASFALPPSLLAAVYPGLQLAAIATLVFERGALLVPLLLWLRATRERGGKLRALASRLRLLELWVATGVLFHVGLAVVLDLGIFPWGCLALYPALASPHTLRAWLAAALLRARRLRKSGTQS
jgi:hypothetical protein